VFKGLKRIAVKDAALSQVQDNVTQFSQQFDKAILAGHLLTDVTIGTSSTSIPHGLARRYQGWHLVDIQGDARVWRDTASTADNTLFIPLKASASVTVSLWVF
jgi:hypothetical protein